MPVGILSRFFCVRKRPLSTRGHSSRRKCAPILASPYRVQTADNDINALYQMNSFPKGWFVNHYFTDTDAWFIRTDVPDGMKYFDRVALRTSMEGDFDTGNMRYKTRERYSFGWTDPRGYFGTAGAA